MVRLPVTCFIDDNNTFSWYLVYANKTKNQHMQQGDALKDSDALLEASSKERDM